MTEKAEQAGALVRQGCVDLELISPGSAFIFFLCVGDGPGCH